MEGLEKKLPEASPSEQIDIRLGKSIAETSPKLGQDIAREIERRVLEISVEEGSSSQLREKAKRYLDTWRGFSNDLFARTSSENLRSPENVETAISGARALMSPELTKEGAEAAHKMIEALQKRYGIK